MVGATAGQDADDEGTDLIDRPCGAEDTRLQARDDNTVEHVEGHGVVLVSTEDDINSQKQGSTNKGDNTLHDILHGCFNTRICRNYFSMWIVEV